MCTLNAFKKKSSRRLSVWVLVFALLLTLLASSLAVSAHAESFMDKTGNAARDAVSDVGDAVSDAGGAVSEMMTDMMDETAGDVSDSDGIIGNEGSETVKADTADTSGAEDASSGRGWIGLVIALVVIILVVVLIIVLIPKKKDR